MPKFFRASFLILLFFFSVAIPSRVMAQEKTTERATALTAPVDKIDYVITAGSLAVWAVQGAFTTFDTFPKRCLWCGTWEFDQQFRNSFYDPAQREDWQKLSDTMLLPLGVGLLGMTTWAMGSTRSWEPLFTVAEALILAGTINGLSKAFFARPRPYTRRFAADKDLSTSDLASFMSGHASFAFSMATALTLSARDLEIWWPLVAVPAYSAASVVAIARVGADKHWLSDVAVAAVVASASVGLVWWLRAPERDLATETTVSIQLVPPSGLQAQLNF